MGANILIVEDEEPLTTLLRYNLEAEGYEVDSVGRGDEADTRLRETAGAAGADTRAVTPRQPGARRHGADDRRSGTRP
jgi:CheY-like chemotaxis protein